MECKTARLLLDFARPWASELDGDEAAALEAHLHDCPECGPLARAERQADERLAHAIRDVPVPSDLRLRLQARLDAVRGRLYRRRAAALAAAAAVLLIAPLGAWFWLSRRPAVDVEVVAAELDELPGLDAGKLERLFRTRYGLTAVLPRTYVYAHLLSIGTQEVEGRRVPRLLFARGANVAEVVMLSGRQFDLQASLRRARAGSGVTVVIQKHPTEDVAYLIVYTGDSLDWLLVREDQGAPA